MIPLLFLPLFFINILPIIIVQTEDNTLHFIKNDKIESVHLSQLGVNTLSLENTSTNNTELQVSKKEYIDNIYVSRDGFIFLDGIKVSVENLIDKPMLYNGIILQLQKKCRTVGYNDVIVFLVCLDLNIIDSKSMYTRIVSFSYIYCLFEGQGDIKVLDNIVQVNTKNYIFNSPIVSVYDTILSDGSYYMKRIYNDGSIVIYKSFRPNTYKLYLSIPLLLLLYIFYRIIKPKKFKLSSKEYETSLYEVYKGTYMKTKIICKKFKKNNDFSNIEISLMHKLNHPSLQKIQNYGKILFRPYILYEYSEIVKSLSKQEIRQFVSALVFLNTQNILYKNFNPINIRRSKDQIILFDVFGPQNNNFGWYFDFLKTSENLKIIFSTGCCLHYFLTGYHPFDTPGTNIDKYFYNDKKSKKYKLEDLKKISENVTKNIFLIRFTDPLKHDLVYHAIKMKTTLHKLERHPYFWSNDKIFSFLATYSDILEGTPLAVKKLERNKSRIFNPTWNTGLPPLIQAELEVYRYYNYTTAKDLIRVIRNKGRHYNEVPIPVKEVFKGFPNGFIDYWTTLFPGLLIVCYNCGISIKDNEMLAEYY